MELISARNSSHKYNTKDLIYGNWDLDLPGMSVNIRYINSNRGTSSNLRMYIWWSLYTLYLQIWGCTSGGVYIPCVYKFEDLPLVEFMYLVFTRMPSEIYRRRLGSLVLYLCYVFRSLINSLCTSALGLVLFQIKKIRQKSVEWGGVCSPLCFDR